MIVTARETNGGPGACRPVQSFEEVFAGTGLGS
jgi:hypothetical protein